MLTKEIDLMAQSAFKKITLCKNNFYKYFIRSVIAGFFIVVATILSNITAAILQPHYPEAAKLLSSFLFSLAIILIIFIGGELFTGNNMIMAIGAYEKKCSYKDMLIIWLLSFIGNFIGAFIFSYLFVKSNVSHEILVNYYKSFINNKLTPTALQLFIRGILCNFCVCLAVLAGVKMKSESGKIIISFCVIMTFVVACFEHCVANMSTFSIAYLILDDFNISLAAKNMLFVTLGNVIGGGILLALPIKLMSNDDF